MKQGKGPGKYLADKLKIRATFKMMIHYCPVKVDKLFFEIIEI